jgi:translation initiation factor 4G
MLSSEKYWAADKAKRHGLGVIRLIGELFKMQIMAERIMHDCVKELLGNVENTEEDIESLCLLLSNLSQLLDTPQAHARMKVYLAHMKELTKSSNVNPRMVSRCWYAFIVLFTMSVC